MDKFKNKQINESLELGSLIFVALAIKAVTWILGKLGVGSGKKDLPLYQFYESDEFLKLLAKVLEEEGGIDEFMKKYKPKLLPSTKEDEGDYDAGVIWTHGGYDSVNWITRVAGNNVHEIIKKIIASNEVQKFLKSIGKENSKSYAKKIGNHLYYFFTSPKFKQIYSDILVKQGKRQEAELMKRYRHLRGIEKENKILLKNLLPKNI